MANKTTISVAITGDAKGATKAFGDAEEAAKGFKSQADKTAKGFEGVRDGADNTERRIIGFRDSLTGTADLTQGFAEGNLVMIATGFADLASSVANLGADLLDWGKKALQGGLTAAKGQVAATAATVKNTAVMVAHKAASVASATAAKAYAAAQWLVNAAMSANPIMLVVVGLAALVAAFVLAWQHSETFRNIVTGAFNTVKDIAMGVWNWISENWPLLLAILTGPIGLAVLAITTHWDTIKGGFTAVKDWIGERVTDVVGFFTGLPGRIAGAVTDAFGKVQSAATGAKDWVGERVSDIVGFFTGLPGRIKDAAAGAFNGIYEAFKAAINSIIRAWNDFELGFSWGGKDMPGPIPDIPGFDLRIGTPDIPYLADGGTATAAGLAVVGERGPELLNLPRGASVIPLQQGAGGAQTVIVELDGQTLVNALVRYDRRNGSVPIRVKAG